MYFLGTNGTALLLDSTLAAFHASTDLDEQDQGITIFKYQRYLAIIIAMLTGADDDHNPFYLVQFDERAA